MTDEDWIDLKNEWKQDILNKFGDTDEAENRIISNPDRMLEYIWINIDMDRLL